VGSAQVIRNGRSEIEADRAVPPFVPPSLTGKSESVLSFHILQKRKENLKKNSDFVV